MAQQGISYEVSNSLTQDVKKYIMRQNVMFQSALLLQ